MVNSPARKWFTTFYPLAIIQTHDPNLIAKGANTVFLYTHEEKITMEFSEHTQSHLTHLPFANCCIG